MILFKEIQVWELLFLIKEIGYDLSYVGGWEAAGKLNVEVME